MVREGSQSKLENRKLKLSEAGVVHRPPGFLVWGREFRTVQRDRHTHLTYTGTTAIVVPDLLR
jgi:hypothetical protein